MSAAKKLHVDDEALENDRVGKNARIQSCGRREAAVDVSSSVSPRIFVVAQRGGRGSRPRYGDKGKGDKQRRQAVRAAAAE